MSDAKTYKGSCHCGKVSYEVKTDLEKVFSCNCSICSKKGYLLNFVPADQFKLLSGDEKLTDYQFNKKNVHHLFCPDCGIQSFGRGKRPDGQAMVAINVRCLDGVELDNLTLTKVDGRSL
ncbi:MAG: GFA family protein [Polyangiaceae bacterium]